MSTVVPRPARTPCRVLRRPARVRPTCCIHLPPDVVRDPDPGLYDAREVFESGGAPTFNSPDINTVGLWPVKPLFPLRCVVRNLSPDASANQTRVDLAWSAWGIGQPRMPISSVFIDLARAGFPFSERELQWPTPAALAAAGRYGVFVDVLHPYDRNPRNNRGEQTVDGFRTSTGRQHAFDVPVRNPTGAAGTVSLAAGPAAVAPWVTVSPSSFALAPGAHQDVKVTVTVPASVPPSPPGTMISATVDVLATLDGAYLGGVSLVILFDA
jgi:hypothetical protein